MERLVVVEEVEMVVAAVKRRRGLVGVSGGGGWDCGGVSEAERKHVMDKLLK